jgi:hypothetical protein
MTVGLLWLAITILGIVLAPWVSSRLKSGIHVHSAAYTANQQIAKQYGGATSDPGVLVLDLPPGQTVHSAGVAAELHAVDGQIAKIIRLPGIARAAVDELLHTMSGAPITAELVEAIRYESSPAVRARMR